LRDTGLQSPDGWCGDVLNLERTASPPKHTCVIYIDTVCNIRVSGWRRFCIINREIQQSMFVIPAEAHCLFPLYVSPGQQK